MARSDLAGFSIGDATLADVLALRHEILRPGKPIAAAHFDGDDDPRTFHLAVRAGGEVVGVVTALPRPSPRQGGIAPAWQLRGMAVRPGVRNQGLGGRLVAATVEGVARRGGRLVWCNARVAAVPVYERARFESLGAVFTVVGLGDHQYMSRLTAADLEQGAVPS